MSAELVAIELQLKGYEGVMSDFRTLDQMLNSLRGRKNRLTIESNLRQAKADVIAYRAEVEKLERELAGISKGHKEGNTWIRNPEWSEMNEKLQQARQNLKNAKQAVTEFQYALRNLASSPFMQTFNKISSMVAHVGSAFQSAGNALTKLTNPFANFTKGMIMGAGYQALNKFTSGLENGFNRYDTMKKYPKIMESFGYSYDEAQKSVNALDQSVRGLPTGLDEMVDMAQRFTATTGSIEKGTKLAIAANNAFLASMSTDTQKYQGMMQLQDVLGGKDMNSREWNSLVSSMTPAIVKMGESLGYTKDNMSEFIQTIRDGKMDNQEFIDQLIKIGNEGGVLEKMAQESKNTWQAFFANIGNAASRMTAGVIQAFDEISQQMTGKDVNQFLADTVIPGIDGMTDSVKKWIKAHPKEIGDFFKSLGKINFKSLARGFGEAVLGLANLVKSVSDIVGDRDLSGIGKFMLWGNALGKAMTIFGGLLKGSRHGFAFFGASLKTILRARKHGGLMGMLTTAFLGDNVKKTEEALDTATTIAPKMGKFSMGLSSVFKGWAEIAAMVGGTAFVGWASVKLFKNTIKEIGEIGEIVKEVDWESAVPAMKWMGIFMGSFMTFGSALGTAGSVAMKPAAIGTAVLGALTTFISGIAALDMKLLKGAAKDFAKTFEYIGKAMNSLNKLGSVSNVGGVKTKLKNAVTLFSQISDILQIERNNPVTGEATGNLKELDSKSTKTIKNIASAISNIKSAVDTLNELSATKMQLGGLAAVMAGARNGFTQLSNLLIDMPSVFKDNTASGWASTMSGTMTNLKSVFDNLVGEGGILASMPKLISLMAEMDTSNVFTDLPSRMQQLGEVLTSVYTSLQGIGAGEYFATNIDNFRAGIKSMKFAIEHLNSIGTMEINANAFTNVNTAIDGIKKSFDVSKIEGIKTQVHNFAESIKTALNALKEIGNEPIEIDAEVKLSSGFYASVSSVVADINDAASDIRSAFRSIPSSLFKTIAVTLSASVDYSGAISAIQAGAAAVQAAAAGATAGLGASTGGRISRGGLLYRSGGGRAFRPRGTDKIPAMLTEGEYVHRKQAVDFFGMDFMRSVNAMDVKGAMNALMTKAGASVGASRQSIVNNTVNNNQRVNLTISSDNPNYVGMQMGRFVGAL